MVRDHSCRALAGHPMAWLWPLGSVRTAVRILRTVPLGVAKVGVLVPATPVMSDLDMGTSVPAVA